MALLYVNEVRGSLISLSSSVGLTK